MKRGIVLNIQRFSIHDGPGIRTLVFMKGCPLRCLWCANPESQKTEVELGLIASRCVRCGKCVTVCPGGAIQPGEEGDFVTDRQICERCGKCADVCAYEAREMAGKQVSVEELLQEVEKDRDFYATSGGGVTIGGGEPTLQHEFVRAFLKRCTERWLHTALETCGHAPWEHLAGILEYVDVLLYDVKHMDPVVHKRLTGVSNRLILENIERIVSEKERPVVVIRVPIVPNLNDSEENITATAKFISKLGTVGGIELLPYHRLGISKYDQFGMMYPLKNTATPNPGHLERLKGIIGSFGLSVQGV